MTLVTLTDDNFTKTVEQAKGVVLVDFWAPWCMPCHVVGPIIERLAVAFDGQVTVGKLDVDKHPRAAERYHITGIPTVGIFRDGKLINQLVGVRPEHIYRNALEAALEATPAESSATETAKPERHSVTVFTTPTCSWCARLKGYLREHQIAFKEVDVSRDARAAQAMVDRSGQFGVPQAWIDQQVVVGFDRNRIAALLGLSVGAA